jgi:hypothetical protein
VVNAKTGHEMVRNDGTDAVEGFESALYEPRFGEVDAEDEYL